MCLLPPAHRPLKDLIHQVAAGFSYNPVSFTDVAAYQLQQQTGEVSARTSVHPNPALLLQVTCTLPKQQPASYCFTCLSCVKLLQLQAGRPLTHTHT